MHQLRNGASFVAACAGLSERIAMVRWLSRLALRRSIRSGSEAVETLSFRGLRLCLDWASAEHVPLREVLIRGEYWPEDAFRPSLGQTIVDVGANAGIYAVYAARQVGKYGRVIAIEPNPAVVPRLERNLQINGMEGVCTVVPVAVSSQARAGALVVGANTTIGTLALAGQSGVEVAVRTLDGVLGGLGLTAIDLMKIDVEGSEIAVLEGGADTVRRTRRIVIEVSEATSVAIFDRLRQAGFERIFRADAGTDSGGGLVFGERRPR